MAKTISIGLIGCGTVGSGVLELLKENGAEIEKKTGIKISVKKVVVRDRHKKRNADVDKGLLTENVDEVLEDNEIDMVVELIGGYEPAKTITLRALKNGKYVVSANKALYARFGSELFEEARKCNSDIYIEAAVAGAIPIVLPMSLSLCANRITSIHAILNGTCNFILTKMMEEGLSYETALKQAQEKGFAEADPALDVNGTDTMHKLVILASIAFGTALKESDVFVEGITGISKEDMAYAEELGYVIRLLGIAKLEKGKLELRVHPTMVPKLEPLASVRNEFNAVMVNGNFSDRLLFQGRGAGSRPTASAVVADIINVAQDKFSGAKYDTELIKIGSSRTVEMRDIKDAECYYYLMAHLEGKAGVLTRVSEVFGKHGVSIQVVIQKEQPEAKRFVPVVLLTHKTREGLIRKVVKEVDALSITDGKTKLIRIEK
ncbi:MAG: homoserine dehydrogenase [archaeon]